MHEHRALEDYEGLDIFSMIARLHDECALERQRNQECSACAGNDIRAALQAPDPALYYFSPLSCGAEHSGGRAAGSAAGGHCGMRLRVEQLECLML